jgi:hypothetical protein
MSDGLSGEPEDGQSHKGHRGAQGASQYPAASNSLGCGKVVRCDDRSTS